MTNAIILGDVHLGKGTSIGKGGVGSTLNSRIVDQLNLLDWTLDAAVENHADHIIITGDVFEEPKPHPMLITLFMSWLKKCQVHDVVVHIILGNHDILRSGNVITSPLDIIMEADLDGIHVYKDTDTIIIGTTAFTMLPFRDRKSFSVGSAAEAVSLVRDSLVYELASIPDTYHKVLIGHLAIEGSIWVGDEFDDLTNELFCPLEMFKGYDYVWMGHVHKPQVLKKAEPYIAHIGSMDISNFGETDHKKHIVVFNCTQSNGWHPEFLPTRPLQKISVSVPRDTVDSTAYVIDEIKKAGIPETAIVRVDVSLTSPDLKSVNKAAIEKYLLANGAFTVNAISESKKVNLIKKDSANTIDSKMDLSAALKTYAETYIEDAVRSEFLDLATEIVTIYKTEGKE